MSSNAEFVDYYKLLDIDHSSELSDIRAAYISKAKEHHPDAGGSVERMRQLNTAYKTLKDASAKAAYDMLHSFHMGNTKPGDYRYTGGRQVADVSDMSDGEVDAFLDSLFQEYRNGPPKQQKSVRQWLRNFFG